MTALEAGRQLYLWCSQYQSPCTSGGPDFTLACVPMEEDQYDALTGSYNGPEQCLHVTNSPSTMLPATTPAPVEECAYCSSTSGCPLPCSYGGCIFDKTDSTNALERRGSCSGRTATLYLNRRGIASVPAGVFDDIAPG